MKIKIKQLAFGVGACLTVAAVLSACQSHNKQAEINDCSAVFETRYVNNEKGISAKKTIGDSMNASANGSAKIPTTCKILEVKIDENTKCSIVGSDRIAELSKSLTKSSDDKIVVVFPENKLDELRKMAANYLMTPSFDVKKYIDSDLVKNLDFPYRGMKCTSSGKEFVVWVGDKKVILSINL